MLNVVSAAEVSPELGGQQFALAPLRLEVAPGSQVQVTDESGHVVVPASASAEDVLRLPVLLPGRYFVVVDGRQQEFVVLSSSEELSEAPWPAGS